MVLRMQNISVLSISFVFVLIGAGCGDPYEQDEKQTKLEKTRRDSRGENEGGTPRADEKPARAPKVGKVKSKAVVDRSSPASVARAFAKRWINFSENGVKDQQLDLSVLATGTYAKRLRASAKSSQEAVLVEGAKPSGRGRVEVVDVRGRGGERHVLVVTREETFEGGRRGLEGATYNVYLADVRDTKKGWAVLRWTPQL